MQEEVIADPSVISKASLPKKKAIFMIALFAGAGAVLVGSFWLFEYLFSPPGSLQVTSTQPGAEVVLNSQVLGATDYRGNYRQGNYQLAVKNSTRSAFPWQRQINIAPSALTSVELDLGPTEQFSSGSVLTLSRGSGLIVNSTPSSVRVFLDGDDIGVTPLARPTPSPGNHTLKLSIAGYLNKEVEVVVTNGWKLEVLAQLFKNPDLGTAVIEKLDIKPSAPTDLKIVSRNELSLDKILGSPGSNTYQTWSSAEFWDLAPSDKSGPADPEAWLKGLYYHSVVHLLLPDLPYHYLISSDGKIYEGRAGGNFVTTLGVSSGLSQTSQAPSTRPGVVLVGYLGGKDPSAVAKDSWHKLVLWLGQPPKLAATATPLTDITLDSGKQREVSLSYHNSGLATWSNFGELRVLLATRNPASVFYSQGNWVDPTHPATITQSYAAKDQDATLKFILTAPKYGGDFEEIFSLTQGARVAEGSEIHLKIHVTGPTKPVAQVRIDETGVGFLRVRSGPGVNFSEISRVVPGDSFDLLVEQSGWYQIKLKDGSSGWISAQFVTKI